MAILMRDLNEQSKRLLAKAGVFFMATVNGNQPKLRPLGTHMEADGHRLRYTGKAVFETDDSYADKMIKESGVETIYNEQTGNKLMTFHLEDATAVNIAVIQKSKI